MRGRMRTLLRQPQLVELCLCKEPLPSSFSCEPWDYTIPSYARLDLSAFRAYVLSFQNTNAKDLLI